MSERIIDINGTTPDPPAHFPVFEAWLEAGRHGEMGYLAKTKRTASIVASSDTSLLKINSTVISQVSLKCQVRFLKVFLRTLIYRLSATTEVISSKAS